MTKRSRNQVMGWGVAVLFAFTAAGCGLQPVLELDRQSMPETKHELTLVNIEDSIARAARIYGWRLTRHREREFMAVHSFKEYTAMARIQYDEKTYSIKYWGSKNLRAEEEPDPETGKSRVVIHRRYNSLIKQLKKGIDIELETPTTHYRRKPSPDYFRPRMPKTEEEIDGDRRIRSRGAGFFVSRDGHIVTNRHVVQSCVSFKLRTRDDKRYAVSLIAAFDGADLALLKSDFRPETIATLRSGRPVNLGDPVTVFGFPLPGALSRQGVWAAGHVSALRGLNQDARAMQISAQIEPGNSGGPLFDKSGNVVGVVYASLNTVAVAHATGSIPQNINFAVKRFVLENFLSLHDVPYESRPYEDELSTLDIVERAKKYTVQVECWASSG